MKDGLSERKKLSMFGCTKGRPSSVDPMDPQHQIIAFSRLFVNEHGTNYTRQLSENDFVMFLYTS